MRKTISAWEARRNFGKLMNEVADDKDYVFVESHGQAPRVAIVPATAAERMLRDRMRLDQLMDEAAENASLSEEDAMEIANAVVAEVRAERRLQESR